MLDGANPSGTLSPHCCYVLEKIGQPHTEIVASDFFNAMRRQTDGVF